MVNALLGSPVHQGVGSNEWGKHVEDLRLGPSVGVEEGIVKHAGRWSLAVLGEGVSGDTLHWGSNAW